MSSTTERPTCKCGVYLHLHPEKGCAHPRPSRWWDRHLLGRHVAARLWLALPGKARWWVVYQMQSDRRCWCKLFDSAWYTQPDYLVDYGDLCDFPLPTDAGRPVGDCYCRPWKLSEYAIRRPLAAAE